MAQSGERRDDETAKTPHQDQLQDSPVEERGASRARPSTDSASAHEDPSARKEKGRGRIVDLDTPVSPAMFQAAMYPDKERLEISRQWWSKRYGRELTLQDAAEIHQNLFGLMKFLAEHDIEQNRIKAGGHAADEKKLQAIRYEVRHLEKQIEAMGKMIKHWPKGEPQRLALEQASKALDDQLEKKRQELQAEIDGPKKAE